MVLVMMITMMPEAWHLKYTIERFSFWFLVYGLILPGEKSLPAGSEKGELRMQPKLQNLICAILLKVDYGDYYYEAGV